MATIHAREWISTEVNRRLLHHFVDNYGKNAEVTNLVNTRELWFVLVANPDGYQHTFDAERLWRKNLRDNNGDGQITIGDGVDLNRNYDEKWNYDNEGSSSRVRERYLPRAEPGVRARDRGDPGPPEATRASRFMVTYHSYGPLLLYMWGFQVQTPTADDPIYVALSGTDAKPAIAGIRPGRRCRPVHHQRHDGRLRARGDGHARLDARARARAATAAASSSPTTKRSSRRSSRRTCRSRSTSPRPRRTRREPVSHLGNTTKPFYLDLSAIDPEKTQQPAERLPLLGLVRRSSARAGAGAEEPRRRHAQVPDQRRRRPERLDVRMERRRTVRRRRRRLLPDHARRASPARIRATSSRSGSRPPAATVKSDSFTYTAKVESSNRVLVLAAEDYTGISPVYKKTNGPSYLSYYLDALAANGIGADVYDVDANGRKAPSHARRAQPLRRGHLVHGRRHPHARSRHGCRHRLSPRERRDARRPGVPQRGRPPAQDRQVRRPRRGGRVRVQPRDERALRPGRSGDGRLPAAVRRLPPVLPRRVPLQRRRRHDCRTARSTTSSASTSRSTRSRGRSAARAPTTRITARRSSRRAGSCRPSDVSAVHELGVGEVRPPGRAVRPAHGLVLHVLEHRGHLLQAPDEDDRRARRRRRTCPSGSRTTPRPAWDHVFVEAHTVGQDDWTTLPDLNGHTTTVHRRQLPGGLA